nr:cell wall-binding repeat-containing protein [Tissierella sp.]
MKRYIKFLLVILVLAIIFPAFTQAAPVDKANRITERIAGENRIQTAIKVSQKSYDKSSVAVIAGYEGGADALTGTLLASEKNAPVLITYKDKLDPNLRKELIRLETKEIYILGGERVINSSLEQALVAENFIVTRLSGETRVETARKIAEEVFGESKPAEAFIVEHDSLVDALAIGPVAAMKGAPIFITHKNEVPTHTKEIISAMEIKNLIIIGGEARVTPKGKLELEKLGAHVGRVSGQNRSKTSLEIANRYFPNKEALIVASGYSFADALVGGYFAKMINAPILLSNANTIDKDAFSYIKTSNMDSFVLGGTKVISERVYKAIETLVELPKEEIPAPGDGNPLPNRTIKYLEKGQDVKQIQIALKKLGYNISIDSTYGPSTKEAVLAYQKRYKSLVNNGIYDTKTRAALIRDLKTSGTVKPNTTKIQTRGLNLNVGKTSDQVKLIKDFFRARGEANIPNDYAYDNKTKQLVSNYQKLRGLPVNGSAGAATLNRMNREITELNYKVGLVKPHISIKGDIILVNKSSNTVYLIRNGVIQDSYAAATGKTSDLTPNGKFKIVVKYKNPAWAGAGLFDPIAGGDPKNPLGTRWIGISLKGGGTYGLHGNAAPDSIGTYASLGCIRMFNPEVEKLYEKVKINTPIWIGNENLLKSYGVVFK